MSAIVFDDVSFGYGRGLGKKAAAAVLDGLSLDVAAGSIYGLLGPSGCGKTTLLSCCLGVLSPRSGTVLLFGKRPHAKGKLKLPLTMTIPPCYKVCRVPQIDFV